MRRLEIIEWLPVPARRNWWTASSSVMSWMGLRSRLRLRRAGSRKNDCNPDNGSIKLRNSSWFGSFSGAPIIAASPLSPCSRAHAGRSWPSPWNNQKDEWAAGFRRRQNKAERPLLRRNRPGCDFRSACQSRNAFSSDRKSVVYAVKGLGVSPLQAKFLKGEYFK